METTYRPCCLDHLETILNDWSDRDDHMIIIYLSPHNKHLEISIFKVIAAEFHLQLYTDIKSRSQA